MREEYNCIYSPEKKRFQCYLYSPQGFKLVSLREETFFNWIKDKVNIGKDIVIRVYGIRKKA